MTTAQYLFQTIINPDVVYKAYLKWLGMLTPSGELVVQIESERFLSVGPVRRTSSTAAQSMD